ncbi:hypothetical protein BH11GEM1_BH11GEM1_21330 [soil metagenome]
MRLALLTTLVVTSSFPLGLAAQAAPRASDTTTTLLAPARVFDGMDMHEGWSVLVRGDRIVAAGPSGSITVPATARRIDLAGTTLMPGMI